MTAKSCLVYLLFLVSGILGLTYEVVWDRYLMTFIGTSTYAHTVILTTFMGGLALGAWLLGRVADRVTNGLRVYAWLEIGIGAYALAFPYLFGVVGNSYVWVAGSLYPAAGALTLIRLVVCGLVLLPPTMAMGGTLPLLTRYLTRRGDDLRERVGRLYFVNSSGAVLGTFVAGFVLLRHLGLPMSLTVAGALNVLLGLVALGSARLLEVQVAHAEAGPEAPVRTSEPTYTRSEGRVAMAVAGIVGFATMGLEVAWVRFWSLVLGTSTYAFSLMLMAFISGIALGALLVSSKLFRRRLTALLFAVFAGTAAMLLFMLPYYDQVPYWFARIRLHLGDTHEDYLAYQGLTYLGCFLSMMVPTVLSGMALPASVRIASADIGSVGRDVGRVYAINTLGTLAGALLTGTVLLSSLGLEWTFRVLFLVFLAGALVVVPALSSRRRWLAVMVLALLAAGHFATYSSWNLLLLNQGLYRRSQALFVEESDTFADLETAYQHSGLHLEALYEGHSTSVALVRAGDNLVMHINGKADASVYDDVTQSMIAHVPLLVHPHPQDLLVVGLGSGYTVAASLPHPVARLDVVELHDEVVAGARHFEPYIGAFLDDERVHLFVDDALHFLRVTNAHYDVISSEPTNPWQAGAGNLFTREYYQLLSAHLKPGGVVLQFIPGYEISDEVVQLLLRTISSEFEVVELFRVHSNDLLMLASHDPISFQPAEIARRLQQPALRGHLARLDADSVAALAAMHQTPAGLLRRMLEPGPVNTLTEPRAEYLAPEAFFRYSFPEFPRLADSRFFLWRPAGLWWHELAAGREGTADELGAVLGAARKAGIRRLEAVLERVVTNPEAAGCALSGDDEVAGMVARYSDERTRFFARYSLFRTGDTRCLAKRTEELLEADPGRADLWLREKALWHWLGGQPEQGLAGLVQWYGQHDSDVWRADDIDCVRILVAGLVQRGDRDPAAEPAAVLRHHATTPQDRALVRAVLDLQPAADEQD